MRSEEPSQLTEARSFLPRRLFPTKKTESCKRIQESEDASSRRLILEKRKAGWCYSALPTLSQWEHSGESQHAKGIRPCRSWYGSLQEEDTYKKVKSPPAVAGRATPGDAGGPSPNASRRALELLLPRHFPPVRRSTSRDSAIDTKPGERLRKCSTVLALTERIEPLRPYNRLRTPSVCSKCSSILSLAGGSRYSLDALGFVAVKPVQLKTQICKLCLEEMLPENLTAIGGCGCSFCTKCMETYVQFEIVNGAYEISCPAAECRVSAALTIDEIRELVDEATLQKHFKFRLNHEVAMDQGRAFCPRVGCDTVCSVRAASPVHCPTCRLDFCSDCNQEWHPGIPCNSAGGPNSSAPLLPDGDLIKWCPMCQVPIEKDEGCAQMMCKRCKHVFCWYCLASLDDDFLLRHYDKGPCKNKLGHSRASVIWHRAQVVGIFAGFGLLLLVASPLLLLAAPCIVCCKCRLCNTNSARNLDETEDLDNGVLDINAASSVQ